MLYVEDDEDDVFFLQHALAKTQMPHNVITVEDGERAIDYLSANGKYADCKRYPEPDVILLDLALPRLHGIEVLEWVRTREQFNEVPIVVLSGSLAERDRNRALELGADAFFEKTGNCSSVVKFLAEIPKHRQERAWRNDCENVLMEAS